MIDAGEPMVAHVLQSRPPQREHEPIGRLDRDLGVIDAVDQRAGAALRGAIQFAGDAL